MSTAEMQACLARLYVSEPFRRWFNADVDAAMASYRLGEDERKALRDLDRAALELFAGSLVTKRRKGVERAFPALFALDDGAMRRHYSRFHQLYSAKPHHDRHQDVIDFGIFVEETLVNAADVPRYASDLARYERLYYLASIVSAPVPAAVGDVALDRPVMRPALRAGVQIADFTYDVGDIEEALRLGEAPAAMEPTEGGLAIVFLPGIADGTGVQMLKINGPARTVIGLCDGTRSVSEIVTSTETALGAADLHDAIVATLDRFIAAGVLTATFEGAAHDPVRLRPYSAAVQNESM